MPEGRPSRLPGCPPPSGPRTAHSGGSRQERRADGCRRLQPQQQPQLQLQVQLQLQHMLARTAAPACVHLHGCGAAAGALGIPRAAHPCTHLHNVQLRARPGGQPGLQAGDVSQAAAAGCQPPPHTLLCGGVAAGRPRSCAGALRPADALAERLPQADHQAQPGQLPPDAARQLFRARVLALGAGRQALRSRLGSSTSEQAHWQAGQQALGVHPAAAWPSRPSPSLQQPRWRQRTQT